MKTMILYTTRHGSAAECAKILASNLEEDATIINIGDQPEVLIDEADTVILGGSIYAGSIQSAMATFIEKHTSILMKKRLGLWVNCSQKGEECSTQFAKVYPRNLRDHAVAVGFFGDAVYWEKLNFLEKLAMRVIAKTKASYEHFNREAIAQFAKAIDT